MSNNKLKPLIDEYNAARGMIAEIVCKSKLFLVKLQSSGSSDELENQIQQMEHDLDTYYKRLKQILLELSSHGIIVSKLE